MRTWASRRILLTFHEPASLKTSSVPLSAAHHTGTETGVPSRLKVVMLTKGSCNYSALLLCWASEVMWFGDAGV
jgi:hypothetical protein